ncbi:MAG TPA: molybdate ABC transporter permease subunit [Gaiellaceae bacterium]|nr:molybdate ABC transporter permease subunit [Gaiellaceae bacterium]
MRHAVVRGLLGFLFFLAIALTMAFLVLPVVAIFVHVPLGRLLHELTNPVVTDALIVSLKTVAISQVAILLLGTPTAYFFATRRFRGRPFLVTLVELPIVLPPAVAGIGLIVAFGRFGLLGGTFDTLGINVSFNMVAVVFAISFVAGPFYVRQAIASFESVDPNMIAASRTLGASPPRTFFRVTLPLAYGGLAAGEAICLARGLGEFGATIMFAGSLQGTTQTLPLAVYTVFEAQNGLDVALAISALLVIVSLAILLAMKGTGLWERSRPAVTAIAQPEPR